MDLLNGCPEQISVEETRRGCSPEVFTSINNNGAIADKYGLELVAGTFFNVIYSGRTTEELLCRFSRCGGMPFPAPIPGTETKTQEL